jgi:hypothetical protein
MLYTPFKPSSMNCPICGTHIAKPKKTQKYCSGACRQEAHRVRHNLAPPKFIKSKTKTVEDVSGFSAPVVQNEAFKRLSMPVPTQAIRISDNSAKSLKEVLLAQRAYYITLFDEASNNVYPLTTIGLGGVGVAMGNSVLEKLIFGALGAFLGSEIDEKRTRNQITRFEAMKQNARLRIHEIDEQLKGIENEERFRKTLTKSDVLTVPNFEGIREIVPKDVMPLSQLQNIKFETLDFSGSEYKELIGNPEPNFLICIYGVAGNGKSTRALKFAEYLSNNHGRVLYNSSEEGFRASMQSKVKDFKANYFHISNCRKFDDLKNLIDKNPARFIFIDSVNDMDITPEQLSQLRKKFPLRGFVIVMQATKAGTYKGDSAFAHDADVIMKLENRQPIIEKTRFI